MPGPRSLQETSDTPAERRDYFRINDRIGLEIQRLSNNQAPDNATPDESPLDILKAEFYRLDQDVKAHLASLAERDRLLTGLIKSLNGKLDTLERIIAFEQNPLQPEDWQDVTLSEGGLSFQSNTPAWRIGDQIAVRMTLPPELYQPEAIAQVLSTEPDNRGGTMVHTEFTRLEDHHRQQIARHVMRWQIRQRQNN